MSGVRRSVWAVPVTLVAIGVLLVVVFPTRTFLAQQASVRAAGQRLAVLEEQNRLLEDRVRSLHEDAEIERIAREEYQLVRVGEEAYAVLPAAPAPAPPPVGTPPALRVDERSAWRKAWDWVANRF